MGIVGNVDMPIVHIVYMQKWANTMHYQWRKIKQGKEVCSGVFISEGVQGNTSFMKWYLSREGRMLVRLTAVWGKFPDGGNSLSGKALGGNTKLQA